MPGRDAAGLSAGQRRHPLRPPRRRLFRAMDQGRPRPQRAAPTTAASSTPSLRAATGQDAGTSGSPASWSSTKVPDRHLATCPRPPLHATVDERTLALAYIDYKSLEVRHLGSIYEGLLEFKLKVAGGRPDDPWPTSKPEQYTSRLSEGQEPREAERPRTSSCAGRRGLPLQRQGRPEGVGVLDDTPDPIVEYIVANTVGPVLDEKLESLRPEFPKSA